MLVIAHVSDLHLDGEPRSVERAERVFGYLSGLPGPIDAVLVTGDIADHGLPAEYESAAKLMASVSYPVLPCPGNHDRRAAYREALLNQKPSDLPINQVHQVGTAVFAMCDSTIPGRDDGFLADETIDWLTGVLAEAPASAPVFVCFHHPPATLHIPLADQIRQQGEQRLAELAAGHPNLVAFLCGHAHTPAATTFAGRPLLVAPGVVSTGRLLWEGGEVVDWLAPPGLAFHILDDDHRLTTHYRMFPMFPADVRASAPKPAR